MKTTLLILNIIYYLCISAINASAQSLPLTNDNLEAVKVTLSIEKMMGKKAVKVIKEEGFLTPDEPTFIKLKGVEFNNGTIEVKVLSRLLPNASPTARGFIGVAFRIPGDNSKFECIYIRPTNGRADDQVRRNHSIQYFSYPDFKFDRLRKETPEQYESYADMELNEWIKLKIVVHGAKAQLFLNENKQPSLIVNDLKLGTDLSGAIGLYVDNGTEGYFSELKISQPHPQP